MDMTFLYNSPELFQVKEVEEDAEGRDATVTEKEYLIILDPSRWEDVDEDEGPVLSTSVQLVEVASNLAAREKEKTHMGKAEETETTQREEQEIHKEKKSNMIEKEERIRKADLSEDDDRREKKKRKRERQKEKKRAEKEANMTKKKKVEEREATLSEIERVEIEKCTFQNEQEKVKIAYLREEGERREKKERKRAEKEASLTAQVLLQTSAELNQLAMQSYSAPREKEKMQEMRSHSKLGIELATI